ncbi:MAG: hypothetical protein C0602_06520 [Denitrovibrio sp.]|nr:MAG: hypothetical protein C0602_06520 [Denitrovibrio sp.]
MTKLNSADKKILKSYEDTVSAIAAFFGSYCEVTLHSLENPDNAIIKIENSHHTRRKVGDSISEHGLQAVSEYNETGRQDHTCYTTSTESGEPMRTIQTVITNEGQAIGLLSISFNMTVPLTEFISTFSLFHQPEHAPVKEVMVADSVEDLIHNAVDDIVKDISTNINIPNHEKNKYIVYGLYEKGVFEIKGSVVLVAKELKLSKYTIYSYVRELKEKSKV